MATELSVDPAVVAKRRQIFLRILASNGGNVHKAALAVGYKDSTTLRRYKKEDPEFSREWDEAIEASNDVIESHIIDRATIGVEEAVYYQGEVCGTKRNHSDGLLTFVAKARMPEKYTERKEIVGTVNHKVGVALIPMRFPSSSDWEATAIAHHESPAALPAPIPADVEVVEDDKSEP